MGRYSLKLILTSRRGDSSSSIISFHRDYNPILGKADVIYCDFGQSDLRINLKAGIKTKDEKLKAISSSFIYALYSKPAFGF